MNYWLCKSDPEEYSWLDLVRDRKTLWTGVRNYLARNHLQAMSPGDLVLIYHSGNQSAVVGVARVSAAARQDPTTDDTRWVAPELVPLIPLNRPVPLSEIKKTKNLQKMVLLRLSRLSVQPVTKAEFYQILKLAQTKL